MKPKKRKNKKKFRNIEDFENIFTKETKKIFQERRKNSFMFVIYFM